MTAAGIPIEFSKGEAAPGQHEVNIHYDRRLESADRAVLFKHGAKEIADQEGKSITFMAKLDPTLDRIQRPHPRQPLELDGETSAFPAEPGSREMSRHHALVPRRPILPALASSRSSSPHRQSYKRYATASWAPVNIVWGRDNRTCGFRVVGSGNALRIENRLPGGDSNPYLAFAAVLAAGRHRGIEHRIEPPAEFRGNGYDRDRSSARTPLARRGHRLLGRERGARERPSAPTSTPTTSPPPASNRRCTTRGRHRLGTPPLPRTWVAGYRLPSSQTALGIARQTSWSLPRNSYSRVPVSSVISKAKMTVLNPNATRVCVVVSRRMPRETTVTSDVANVAFTQME